MKSESAAMENFIREFLSLLIERARKAKDICKAAKDRGDASEELAEGGRAQGYYEIVCTFLGQAEVFGLTEELFPELRFDPDKELLP